MLKRYSFLGIIWALVWGAALADSVVLNPDHPDRYVVVKGDTLWDISAKFLRDPWRWPDIWQINPEIQNPHLIFPGDVIRLVFREGRPVLEVDRGGVGEVPEAVTREATGDGTVKLSPTVHTSTIDRAIRTIPVNAINQFLQQPQVVTQAQLDGAAYVVASEEGRLISAEGDKIYVRGIADQSVIRYSVVRPGSAYRNPGAKRKDVLGYEALHVADAVIEQTGDPTTLRVTHSKREILLGDRLLPVTEEGFQQHFQPHAPAQPVDGAIISVVDGVSRIGQYQIVVINLGESDRIEPGHVLAVYQTGEMVRDTVDRKRNKEVQLPDLRAALLMVVRTYERVSYALVMNAERDIRIYDRVTNP